MNTDARFGWTLLLVFVLFGVGLEGAHAFKASAYLDDELTRLLLTLAHAHGVGLALVLIGFGATVSDPPKWTRKAFRVAAVCIPLGFALGAIAHPEGDPSLGIALVPIGAFALVAALAHTVYRAWR